MDELPSSIPTEFYLAFLDQTIEIHWGYHALLMTLTWLFLVPVCILAIRFGKPRPKFQGLRRRVSIRHAEWWWFSLHKYGLYVAMFLSAGGGIVAFTVSGGFSGTVHAVFGILAVTLGVIQVVAGWLRGTHGGKYYYTADPDDPATWSGDHYSMTRRRRVFEAYHKNAGYFASFCALAAVASGLSHYPLPWLLPAVIVLFLLVLALAATLDFKGLRYDGYKAAHGTDPENPYNFERKDI